MRTEHQGPRKAAPWRLALLLACAGMLCGGPAAGAEPVAGPGSAEVEEMPQMPADAGALPAPESFDGTLVPAQLAPVDPLDKGSFVTSLPPVGAQGALTAREATKLEMARSAIESARRAGDLAPPVAGPDDAATASPAIADLKLRLMLESPSAIAPEDLPADRAEERAIDLGMPDHPAPLTPEEEAKLAGALSGSEGDAGAQGDDSQAGKEER